jgi:hypothetical protein
MNLAIIALIIGSLALALGVFLLFVAVYLLRRIHEIINKDYRLRKP